MAVVGCWAGVYAPGDVPNVQLQDSTRLVSNPDGILSAPAEAQINATLRDIRSKTSAEPALVVIDDMADGYDIDNFATDLFTDWGLGKKDKDNGLLILVVKNARKYVIRTGYGVEGVLPDVVCARIQRRTMAPSFREGDFDGGLLKAVQQIDTVMTDPSVRDELMSKDTDKNGDITFADIVKMYLLFCLIVAGCMLAYFLITLAEVHKKDRHDKYLALRQLEPISRNVAWFTLGFTLIVYFPVRYLLNKWRNGPHPCPNCGTLMNKIDEEHDNDYLSPAQDTEEKIGSVDYDVWLCPNCGEKDVYAYSNPNSGFTECPKCHAKACVLRQNRIIQQPTESREGYGVREYYCNNCKSTTQVPYKIAKLASAAPIVIGGIGGRGGGGFGGGFGGGGFGGGMTGGGGASGGW